MYVIYGKPSCPQCDKAKNLLKSKDVPFQYLVLDVDYTKEELLSICPTPPRQLPQIFKEMGNTQEYVGGFEDLQKDLA